MKRSHLKNILRKTGNPEDRRAYKKQMNLVVKLNKQQKQSYFRAIDANNSKKSLWKMPTLFFKQRDPWKQDYFGWKVILLCLMINMLLQFSMNETKQTLMRF